MVRIIRVKTGCDIRGARVLQTAGVGLPGFRYRHGLFPHRHGDHRLLGQCTERNPSHLTLADATNGNRHQTRAMQTWAMTGNTRAFRGRLTAGLAGHTRDTGLSPGSLDGLPAGSLQQKKAPLPEALQEDKAHTLQAGPPVLPRASLGTLGAGSCPGCFKNSLLKLLYY